MYSLSQRKCKECIDSPRRLSIARFSYLTLIPVNGRVVVETILVGVRTLSMTEDPVYNSVRLISVFSRNMLFLEILCYLVRATVIALVWASISSFTIPV